MYKSNTPVNHFHSFYMQLSLKLIIQEYIVYIQSFYRHQIHSYIFKTYIHIYIHYTNNKQTVTLNFLPITATYNKVLLLLLLERINHHENHKLKLRKEGVWSQFIKIEY